MKIVQMAVVVVALSTAVFSQEQQFIRDGKLSSGFYFKTIGAGDAMVTLLALPQVYSCGLKNKMALDAVTTPVLAVSSYDESSVLRLSSTKLRLSYVYREMAIGTVGIKVPVGVNQFTTGQERTAGLAATRQLGVRNSDLYNTFDISSSVSTGTAFKDVGSGDLSVGGGLSLLIKLPFQPQEGGADNFNPGDEFAVSFAGEYAGRAGERKINVMLDMGFTIYGSDTKGDNKITDVGNKFNWAVAGKTEMYKLPVSARLANYIKGANTVEKIGETTQRASDRILTVQSGLPFAQLKAYQPFGSVTMGWFTGGSAVGGDAFIVTLGGGGLYRLTEQLALRGDLGVDVGGYSSRGVFGVAVNGGLDYSFNK